MKILLLITTLYMFLSGVKYLGKVLKCGSMESVIKKAEERLAFIKEKQSPKLFVCAWFCLLIYALILIGISGTILYMSLGQS